MLLVITSILLAFFCLGNGENNTSCSDIPDISKFDCHPDKFEGDEEKSCLERKCCYTVLGRNVSSLGTPFCYFPTDYLGYSIVSNSQDARHIKATLKRNTPSGFPGDITNLNLLITFIDDQKLRIQITDRDNARFEVPIPINTELGELENPLYDVKLNSKTAELLITRKATGMVVFKTALSQMVYSDQFLQLSSHLPSPYFYGIGEVYYSFLRSVNWMRISLLNSDRVPTVNYPNYGSQPFYLSLEKDSNANGVFLFNSNPMDVILQPTPAITYRPIGGVFDFFVMLGPSPGNVVQQYTSIVGRTFMPPYWSLGFHLCRYGYDSLNKTRETMQRTLDALIPLDVQWNDIDYMDRYKDFTFDEENYAGLPEFVDELHSKGMHYVMITDPGISNAEKAGTYPPFDEGLKEDVFIKNPNGSLFVGKVWTDGELVYPDFSHPNATSYWQKQFADFHDKIKFDGIWIDMNEPSNFYSGEKNGCINSTYEYPPYVPNADLPLFHKTVCMTAKHYETIHYNEHNLYAYREAAATNAALRNIRQKRPFVISRANFAGQGVQSGHWSGDIYSTVNDMHYSISSMLNFNIFGMSMIGSDICGFHADTTVPVCTRWTTLGAFYPFARNHNDRGNKEQDPVALGPVVVLATRNGLTLRYLLLPYLYTLFYRSHVYGDTVARSLMFEFPEDENTYAIDTHFLWGSSLMIVPVLVENATDVTVYFPRGLWYDWEGYPLKSTGQNVTLQIPLVQIGVYVRAGAALPAQFPALNTVESRKNDFAIVVYLDEKYEANGELYWDDGDSLDTYKDGKYNLFQFAVSNNTFKSTVIKNGFDDKMPLGLIQIAGLQKAPSHFIVNGVECSNKPPNTANRGLNVFSRPKFSKSQKNSSDISCFFVHPEQLNVVYTYIEGISLTKPVTASWS